MQQTSRKFCLRVSALVIVLVLLLSMTSAFAASAGIKYNGSSFKRGSSYSMSKMKRAFGTGKKQGECVGIFARYKFSRSGLTIYADQAKKNGSLKIKSITVTSSRISTLCGFKVGSKINKKNGTYSKNGVRFKVKNKKVTAIYM